MKMPIVGAAYRSRSLNMASQQCINLYPEICEVDQSVVALYGTPGSRKLCTLPGEGGIRAVYTPSSGKLIAVRGDTVYRIDGNWNYVACIGTLLTKSGPVSIADNGTIAAIVDGNYGYTMNLATSVVELITSESFNGGANIVQFLDGYFVFNRPNTQVFFWSDLYSSNVDGLSFASAEGAPDVLVSLIVDHRECWMFGDTSTEVFVNTGDPDQPIQRMNGAFLEHGCAAPHSVAKLDNTVFWVGKDANGQGTIWRANGYTPQRISTHAIEYAIQTYPRISDATAYTYQQDGHAFYVLTFPTANKTWCYDAATQMWHERAYRDTTTGNLGRHRSNCCAFFGGVHVVGDYNDGRIYALDPDYFTDDGDPLVALRSAANLKNAGKRLFHRSLLIEVESGISDQQTEMGLNLAAAEVISAMVPAPDQDRRDLITTAINTLVDAGVWDKLDSLQVYAAHSQQAGLIDWKRLGTVATITSSSAFTVDVGFVGDGTNYIDTKFVPSTDGTNYTLNNASFGLWLHTVSTGNPELLGERTPTTTLNSIYSGGAVVRYNVNKWGYVGSYASDLVAGFVLAQRTSSSSVELYNVSATTAIDVSATSGPVLSSNSFWIGANNGSVIPPTNAKLSVFWAGAALTQAERVALQSAFATYMAGL